MRRPRLIYYNDAHHYHGKRIDPTLTMNKLRQPVDEVLSTGVDLLILGLGYGDVYFHQSNVGRVIGEEKDTWENYIDWRIMRMVEDAAGMGTDQVRENIRYAREIGMPLFPSLKMQDTARQGAERCGWLKWKYGKDVCFGGDDGDRNTWAYDFTNRLVQENKLAMVREMLEDYEADGIELDFMFYPVYFRPGEVDTNVATMNDYVNEIRGLANEIGQAQGREIPIAARVAHRRDDNLKLGLDVETWLEEGSIDLVIGQVSEFLLDTGLPDVDWLADKANQCGAAAYIRSPRYVYDERSVNPDIEVYRALLQNLHLKGFAGLYFGYLGWPFDDYEYKMLRELANPQSMHRRNKRYILQPKELPTGPNETPQPRELPMPIIAGETTSVSIDVADDIENAIAEKDARNATLTLRFEFFCIEDDIEFWFNDVKLPREDAEVTDERAMHMPKLPGWFGGEIAAPPSSSMHWFRWSVDPALVRHGENVISIEAKNFEPTAGFDRKLNGVELRTRYKEFERPQGFDMPRIQSRS